MTPFGLPLASASLARGGEAVGAAGIVALAGAARAPHSAGPLLAGLLATLVCAPVLAAAARRAGWVDRADGALAARKLQGHAVPAVGGGAILVGLAAAWIAAHRGADAGALAALAPWVDARAAAAALVLAFAAGAWDDRAPGGLRPRTKLALQLAAGLPVAAALAAQRLDAPAAALALALAFLAAAAAAQNAVNTFDNADGAATGLGALAFGLHAPALAGPLLGFLPWNLNARRSAGARATPTAYLGDAGSHLIGMLLVLVPAAWPALALPALDLARLAVRRARVGSRPWIGDRRHLAHRLAHAGLGRPAVCAALAAIALPALAWPGAVGLGATAAAFALAVALTSEPPQHAAG
jgi:UDP-N-acetylmuramyl pentapeptide phosphotransferase/UDP-N-acetylglucosamine-1-phosphate transferase